MGDSALIFRIQGWIDAPSYRGIATDGLNTAVYNALGEAGIEIPFPQRVVTMVPPPTGYRHVGDLKYIAADNSGPGTGGIIEEPSQIDVLLNRWRDLFGSSFNLDRSIFVRLRDLFKLGENWEEKVFKAFNGPTVPEHLVDHSPHHYAIKVWNEFVRLEQENGPAPAREPT